MSELISEHARSTGKNQPSLSPLNAKARAESPPELPAEIHAKYGDLNKVSEFALRMAKANMDVDFEKRRITTDNPEFVWDKREEFQANEPSEWDEEDEASKSQEY